MEANKKDQTICSEILKENQLPISILDLLLLFQNARNCSTTSHIGFLHFETVTKGQGSCMTVDSLALS